MQTHLVWTKLKNYLMTLGLHRIPNEVFKTEASFISYLCDIMKKWFPDIIFNETPDRIYATKDDAKIIIKVRKLESENDLNLFQSKLIEDIRKLSDSYGIGFGIDMTKGKLRFRFDNWHFGDSNNIILIIKSFISRETFKDYVKKESKRSAIRTDLLPQDEAKKKILELCPEEAGITSISFDENLGKVYIEAKKPRLVIGCGGLTLKQIIENIGWCPSVSRIGDSENLPWWKRDHIF
jgi:hypothetical protein